MKRAGMTAVLILLGTLAWASSTMPWLDGIMLLLVLALLVLAALSGVVWWVWGNFTENRANTMANPTPPPGLKPRYWPGSKADVRQKAADRQQGKEVA